VIRVRWERHAERADELAAVSLIDTTHGAVAHRRRVPPRGRTPGDFWEALQYYWFVHLGVTTELNTWDAYDPAARPAPLPVLPPRPDDGTLTRDQAKSCSNVLDQVQQPARAAKVGVTAAESGTYTDFAQINIGGLREDGSDASTK